MSNVDFAIQAKSDQLNAVDLAGGDRIIRVRAVDVQHGRDQPVWIYFDGDNNKPWKPSKGMLRIISGCWGLESDNWVGKSAQLYMEPSVVYAGKEVGGIWIRAMSDIDPKGRIFPLAINRKKRIQINVACLSVDAGMYPEDKFNAAFGAMVDQMKAGKTVDQIVARCQQTGNLTGEQISRLNAAADELNQPQAFVPPSQAAKTGPEEASEVAQSVTAQQDQQPQSIDEF